VNLHIGNWHFDQEAATIVRDGTSTRLGPRGVAVLALLSRHANEIVSNAELLAVISGDDTPASVNALHKCITDLRHALGDEADQPQYIETIPRRGYRLVARVIAEPEPTVRSWHARNRSRAIAGLLGVSLAIGGFALGYQMHKPASPVLEERAKPKIAAPEKSLAVLAFRSGGNDAADQRAAEAISSKIFERLDFWRAVKLAPRDAAYGHALDRESAASIGRAFGVAYVLDGSLSRRGGQMHVSIRVIHADDGVVVYAREQDFRSSANVDLQGQIVSDVLRAASVLFNDRWQDMQESGTKSIDAYLACSDGIKAARDGDLDGALAYTREAIRLDPTYLQAFANLAGMLVERAASASDRGPLALEVSDLATRVARFAPNSLELREILVHQSEIANASLRDREAQLRSEMKVTPRDAVTNWYSDYAGLLFSARLFDLADAYLKTSERVWGYLYSVERVELTVARETPEAASSLLQTSLRALPNDVGLVTMAVPQLLREGHSEDADRRLEEIEKVDKPGKASYAAAVELRVMRGEFNDKPTELKKALDDPRSTDLLRGIVAFMQGDVDTGTNIWRSMSPDLKLQACASVPLLETLFPNKAKSDPRYLELLDEFDVGKNWTAYMRAGAEDLARTTGIWPDHPQA